MKVPQLNNEFNIASLEIFLKESHLIESDILEVIPYTSGRSNLTYLIKTAEWEGVLRSSPPGPLPPKAHDMKREYEVTQKLNLALPAVPKPYLYCEDKSVLGVPFYVMEKKEGITLEDKPELNNLTDEQRIVISENVVNTMSTIHLVDCEKFGLETIGYPECFLERQLRNWHKRYQHSKTEDLPLVDEIVQYLENNLPPEQKPTLIHNDFKINNMLFTEDFTKVTAVLDWEMATIGDPLFDLGATLSYWLQYDDSELITSSLSMPTVQKGFYTRDQFLHQYSLKTGRDVSNISYYLVLAYFKIAIAIQQIYYRYRTGKTIDQRFKNYNHNVKNILQYIQILMDKGDRKL